MKLPTEDEIIEGSAFEDDAFYIGAHWMLDLLKPQIEELEKHIEQLEKERDENKEKIHFYDDLAASWYFNLNQSNPFK